jgi:hypothetical protein
LEVARRPERKPNLGVTVPGVDGADVRLVQIRAKYGDEAGDDHEGEAALASIAWAIYAVLGD